MKVSFLIKAKEENVITECGVRTFIMERLLNSPFAKGSVSNIDNKTVQVQIEGDEKQIREFVQNLERGVIAQFGNPTVSFTQFQENPALEIPELMRSSQALVVGQLQKGISVQLEIAGTLKEMSAGMKGMSAEMKEMSMGMKEMSVGMKGLSTEMRGMSTGIKELPHELARAMGK